MPDEKISQLPPVTAVVASDLAVAVASGTTSRLTEQQLINALVSFITGNVNIGGGIILLKTDGSSSFAGGAAVIDAAGNIITNTTISNSSGSFFIEADGSGGLSASKITWDTAGNFSSISYVINSGQTALNADGSASFLNGQVSINSSGNILLTTSTAINGDGSASFAGGAVTISATGVVSGVFQPPGIVNPNGSVTAAPGATYFNKANSTFWFHNDTVVSNTGWVQLI